MLLRSILVLALVAPFELAVAADGVLYTCVDAKGRRTYQNQPCPAGSAVYGLRPYQDPGWDPRAAAKVAADRRALDQQRNAQGPSYVLPRSPDAKDCLNAQARRSRIRQQVGSLRMTWEQEVQLCQPVQAVCGTCSPGYPPLTQ